MGLSRAYLGLACRVGVEGEGEREERREGAPLGWGGGKGAWGEMEKARKKNGKGEEGFWGGDMGCWLNNVCVRVGGLEVVR